MACNNDNETPSMRALLIEQLAHLRGMRWIESDPPLASDVTGAFSLDDWYSDTGGTFELIDFVDDLQREACAYAWGYLRGAAEMADVTLRELLDQHGLSFDDEPDPVFRCACSWVGSDPDVRKVRGVHKATCPACWKQDRRRVEVFAHPNTVVCGTEKCSQCIDALPPVGETMSVASETITTTGGR